MLLQCLKGNNAKIIQELQFLHSAHFLVLFCLFDLMLNVHGIQLWSYWDGPLLNHTVPGQASRSDLPELSAHSFTSN